MFTVIWINTNINKVVIICSERSTLSNVLSVLENSGFVRVFKVLQEEFATTQTSLGFGGFEKWVTIFEESHYK